MIKNYLFLLVFCLIIFLSCQNEVCNCPVDELVQRSNDSLYLSVNEIWRKQKFWEKYDEPYLDTIKYEVYRIFSCNVSSDFKRITRIERNKNEYHLSVKVYNDASSLGEKFDFLPSSKNITRILSKSKWDSITNKIDEYCFWTKNSQLGKSNGCLDGGGVFFLEGYNPNMKYTNIKPWHIVAVGHCGIADSLESYKYYQLCNMLLDLDKE